MAKCDCDAKMIIATSLCRLCHPGHVVATNCETYHNICQNNYKVSPESLHVFQQIELLSLDLFGGVSFLLSLLTPAASASLGMRSDVFSGRDLLIRARCQTRLHIPSSSHRRAAEPFQVVSPWIRSWQMTQSRTFEVRMSWLLWHPLSNAPSTNLSRPRFLSPFTTCSEVQVVVNNSLSRCLQQLT